MLKRRKILTFSKKHFCPKLLLIQNLRNCTFFEIIFLTLKIKFEAFIFEHLLDLLNGSYVTILRLAQKCTLLITPF